MVSKRALDVLEEYKSRETGLFEDEVQKRLLKYGRNSLKKKDKSGWIRMIGRQFTDLMVIILLVAGTLAFIFNSFRDAGIMFLIVAVNAMIGFFQEFKIEKTLSSLSELLPQKVRVFRNSRETEILSESVVLGDVIVIAAGEDIPADAIILESYGLKTDESTLTGESHPVPKEALLSNHQTDENMVFMGTTVVGGSAKAAVISTGFSTRFGKIASLSTGIKRSFSPLQKKLNQMSKLVARIAIIILAVVVIYGAFTGKDLMSNFLFALALAAAVVPEGLPATVSVALSLAASRLAKKNALVKKLTSTESLGAATVICTDKTGTITEGKMEIETFWSLKQGKIRIDQLKVAELDIIKNIFALCNHAEAVDGKLSGNYNEISLLEYLTKNRVNFEKLRKYYSIIHEIPFSSERKMMSVVVKIDEAFWLLTKGLPEKVVKAANLSGPLNRRIQKISDNFSEQSLHNLAFAYKRLPKGFKTPKNLKGKTLKDFDLKLEAKLDFLGIVGLSDPIKEGVVEAVKNCHLAGIRVNMITGDSIKTDLAIDTKINLFNDKSDHIFTGLEVNRMSDLELRNVLQKNVVFAEIDPEHKLKIVENLQALGEIVAMTGDGVNDAPALKRADIGVSMGKKGTDVAKEAADMILLDDNFTTIVKAIYEGRIIFENIQKIVYYVFANNAGELFTVVLGILLQLPLPIIAVQILAIDLGTNVLPSLSLAADKGDQSLMREPAQHRGISLLNQRNITKILVTGLVVGAGANISFYLLHRFGYPYTVATTASYATIALCQIISIWMTHLDFRGSILSPKIFDNTYLILAEIVSLGLLFSVVYLKSFQSILSTAPLNPVAWCLPVLSALLLAVIGQIFFMKKLEK